MTPADVLNTLPQTGDLSLLPHLPEHVAVSQGIALDGCYKTTFEARAGSRWRGSGGWDAEAGAMAAFAEALEGVDFTDFDVYVGVGAFMSAAVANGLGPAQLARMLVEDDNDEVFDPKCCCAQPSVNTCGECCRFRYCSGRPCDSISRSLASSPGGGVSGPRHAINRDL